MPTRSSEHYYYEFGEDGNLPAAESSTYVIHNMGAFTTLGIWITVPTGGTVTVEGTVNSTDWYTLDMEDATSGLHYRSITSNGTYLGMVCSDRYVRVRVTGAGSAPGMVKGRLSRAPVTLASVRQGPAPHDFGYAPVHKGFSTSSTSDHTIWTPSTGKKFVVTDIQVSTDDENIVVFFEGTDDTDMTKWLAKTDIKINGSSGITSMSLKTPYVASTTDAPLKLKISTSGKTVFGVVYGYEI